MRIVHYINQFFAGIGGEEKADTTPPQSKAGCIGPGRLLQQMVGNNADVVGTVICGDGLFADEMEQTAPEVLRLIAEFKPDVVIAGPAFNAGRYGLACGRVCADVEQKLKIPAVTGMYCENAGVEVYGGDALIVPTAASALGMNAAMTAIGRLAVKLGRGEVLGPAAVEGYLPRGQRRNTRVGTSASARALDLLLARLKSESFETEVPLPKYEAVTPPAPVADLRQVRLALVTESGLVPKGNPGRLEWVRASRWLKYDIAGKDRLEKGEYEVIHSGYDAAFAFDDPNRLVPVDAARKLARSGEIGSLLDTYYVTCGNHGILSEMAQYSKGIAVELKEQGVGAVLLVATWGSGTRSGATMAKEVERAGIPTVLITSLSTVALKVGANRVLQGKRFSHPCGNPTLNREDEEAWRLELLRTALRALTAPVTMPTLFELEA